jgi:hypothetical protein
MKKWVLLVVLYVLGGLFLSDVLRDLIWISERIDQISERYIFIWDFAYILIFMIPFSLMLLDYFALRLRSNNPVFTFLNALFIPLYVLLLMVGGITQHSYTLSEVFVRLVEFDVWKNLWQMFPIIFILSGVNLLSGITISEAKTKGIYLGAEITYLFTGITLILFSLLYLL